MSQIILTRAEYMQEFRAKAMLLGDGFDYDPGDHTIWRNDPIPGNGHNLLVYDADTMEVLDYTVGATYDSRSNGVLDSRLGYQAYKLRLTSLALRAQVVTPRGNT